MTRRQLLVILAAPWARLSAQAPEWRQALPGRAIELPRDHRSHPEYRIEWWYYTGNLDSTDGRRFGYQLTFFRIGIVAEPAIRSRWAVRDLFMAHAALTDVRSGRYRSAERMNRAGPGWAGASTSEYRVWNDDWAASADESSAHHLEAKTDAFAIDLRAIENRPPVLHGIRGYSRKGSAAGNASHYYSLTRMPTAGTIVVDGQRVEVRGDSWMDHEFGTSFLEPAQTGWDWFSLQLSDGRDLMIFQMRREDGAIDTHSSGTLVEPDGSFTTFDLADGFHLQPGRTWRSPETGARYPVAWRVIVPAFALDLSVDAAVDGQELRSPGSSGIAYWEGAIDIAGSVKGRRVTGRGYLEMTGYSGPAMGTMLSSR